MAQLKFARVNALPAVLAASTVYFVASGTDLAEVYISNNDGSAARHVISKTEIQAMMTQSVADFTNIRVLADIAARNALVLTRNVLALVLDATGDETVATGAALYIFDAENGSIWSKVSEFESLDVQLTWDAIQNKPASTVADIDSAVAQKHSHANKALLDKVGEDAQGVFQYAGAYVQPVLAANEW